MTPISSPQNPRVKLVRQLQQQAKARRREQRLVLEGVRLVRDALESGPQPDFVCYTGTALTSGESGELIAALHDAAIPGLHVTDALMRAMSDTETPQGILGVFPWPDLPVLTAPDLVLVADGWRDPGNLGTVIRTAAAAGVALVAVTPGTVDPFNPKALRAGMGAHFRVPIRALDWADLASAFGDLRVYLADAAAVTPYDTVDWTHPSLLVVGGEAHGFSQSAHTIPHTLIRIPMVAGAESLNAAVAASVLIYEARRHALRGDSA